MIKADLIQEVIKVSGVERRLTRLIHNQFLNLPGGQQVIKQGKTKLPQLLEAVADRYDKWYTEDMLIACLKFYSTEVGQQVIEAQEGFESDLSELVQAWVATAMGDAVRNVF